MKLPIKVGDVLELTVTRVPVYASSGTGVQRQSKKRMKVTRVGDDYASVIPTRRGKVPQVFRLHFDKRRQPYKLRGAKSQWEVESMRIAKREAKGRRRTTKKSGSAAPELNAAIRRAK